MPTTPPTIVQEPTNAIENTTMDTAQVSDVEGSSPNITNPQEDDEDDSIDEEEFNWSVQCIEEHQVTGACCIFLRNQLHDVHYIVVKEWEKANKLNLILCNYDHIEKALQN